MQFSQEFKRKDKKYTTETINLNTFARTRILNDMIEHVKKTAKMSPEYIVLVLDEGSQKIISNFCTCFDLMQFGNIYQMELLHKHRKRYPMSDVLYFLQPTKKSIDLLLNDFKDNDELDFDQYGIVHLCFTGVVPKPLFSNLSKSQKLLSKIRTLLEINVNYQVWQSNIFKTPLKAKQLAQILSADKHSPIVENLAEQIYTLCSSLQERPYIQYQGNSDICELVASVVYNKLEYLYNQKGGKNNQWREPRGILFITDRTLDLVSPFIHDYHYQSAIFDYLKIPEDGSLEKIIPHQKSDQRQAASENEHIINEKDEIWNKFKYYHLAEVSEMLNDEIKQLREQQDQIKKLSKRDDLQHNDIQNLLKQLPEFEQRAAKVLIHYDLIQKITNYISSDKVQLMKMVELEQTIVSGVNDSGKEVQESTIGKELVKILKTLGNSHDTLRLLAIYTGIYDLPEADFTTCLRMLNNKEEMEILKSLRALRGNENPKKIQRSKPVLAQSEFAEYKRKYVQEIQEQYDILRTSPEIYKLVKDIITKTIDSQHFPFIGPEPDNFKSARNVNWHRVGDDDQEGRLIVFMIGGISHYEICCLQNLEKEFGASRLVMGSNEILTSRQFCQTLGAKNMNNEIQSDEEIEKKNVKRGKKEEVKRINDSDEEDQDQELEVKFHRKQASAGSKFSFKKTKKKEEIDVTVEQEREKPKTRNAVKSTYHSEDDEEKQVKPKFKQRQRTKPRDIIDIEQEFEEKELSAGKRQRPKRRLDKESEEVTEQSYRI